jgi:kumamolisin
VVPDVAALANFHGYFLVVNGHGQPNGGTSAAAPVWASLIGRVNATLGPQQTVGYLTPLLYEPPPDDAAPLGAGVCLDITSGDNVTAAVGGYAAGPGYDAMCGWGSPKGMALAAALEEIAPVIS